MEIEQGTTSMRYRLTKQEVKLLAGGTPMTPAEDTELALARREYQSAIEDRRNGAISLATYFERLWRAEEVIERLAPEDISRRKRDLAQKAIDAKIATPKVAMKDIASAWETLGEVESRDRR